MHILNEVTLERSGAGDRILQGERKVAGLSTSLGYKVSLMMKKYILAACYLFIAVACPAQQSFILNGNMESGTDKPDVWASQGTAHITRDTTVYKTGSASLRIDWDGGSGGAYQKLNPTPTSRFTVKGSVHVEGIFEVAQVAIQSFDPTRKQIGWKAIANPRPGTDWTDFMAQIEPLPAATSIVLLVAGKGTGKIWLDDVSVESVETNQPTGPAGSADSAVPETPPLPMAVAADDPHLLYSGRFDVSDPKAPRCAWPASSVALRFKGRAANVSLNGQSGVRWQVMLDGQPGQVLLNNGQPQLLNLAKDLADGEHTVTLLKRTEPSVGTAKITGFQLNEGAELLQAAAPARRIEVIGDSISAGFGNEAASQNEKFTPDTENAGIAYGALAARALQAEYVCIAWSGKTLWPKNTITELYDRIIPEESASAWDFSRWKPHVVVINLGTNDFSHGNPEEEGWTAAYKEFIARVRKNYPDACIFCAISPMMSDPYSKSKNARTTILHYIGRVVEECQKSGESKVALLELPGQTGALGFGAQWHPSAKQHEATAVVMEQAIREKLGW